MKKPIPKGKKGKGIRKLKKVAPQVAKRMGYKKGKRVCQMAKLCPAGKAAAKKKFDVYPSAYANIWASKYCKGKVGRTKKADGGFIAKGCGKVMNNRRKKTRIV